MRSPSSKCESPTRFFKFIPPGCIFQVSVPIAFRKYLKRLRKTKPAVLRRGSQKWRVKINNDWVFGDGWGDFVRENGVQDLEIVVFKHKGNMVFDIQVFDLTWCEKDYTAHDQVKEKKAKKALCEATSSQECKTIVASSLPNEITEMKVVHNPCFKAMITSYGISNNYLNIPMKFARSNGLFNKNCESVVVDEKGADWRTTLCSTSERLRIRGLRKVWAANGLKKGDEFLLEAVDNGEKPVMNLHEVRQVLGTVIR